MPLVSYIRIYLRYWYYAPLVPVVKILKKQLGSPENFGQKQRGGGGGKCLRNLTKKSVNFSTLATSNIRLLLFLVKRINKRN